MHSTCGFDVMAARLWEDALIHERLARWDRRGADAHERNRDTMLACAIAAGMMDEADRASKT